jgi:site-specific DNA-methyltransferase (adenine-specific)
MNKLTDTKNENIAAEYVAIDLLKPSKDNPRINDHAVEKVAKSIQTYGFAAPIVAQLDGTILAGHTRFKAAQLLKLTKVPCRYINLTGEKAKLYRLADNKLSELADWDLEMLSVELTELSENYKIELNDMGFSDDDLFNLLDIELPDNADDIDIDEKDHIDIKEGDLITIGKHRLLCGDSTNKSDIDILMGEELFDLVITDPPYNVNYTGNTAEALTIKNDNMSDSNFYEFLYNFFCTYENKTKKGGSWYVWHADLEGLNFRKAMHNSGLMIKQNLIWDKNSLVMGRQDYHWKHEPCLYGWKKGASHNWYGDRKQSTVLNFDKPRVNDVHPTMKPVELIKYQIENSSKLNDIVGDGFLGSGTTMVAAEFTKRKCYGMELDPKYCSVIINRMINLFPDLEVKINGEVYVR